MGRPVVHWEMLSQDPQKLAAFYEALFGWKIRHLPELDYRMVETGSGGGIDGGILKPRREEPWPGNMVLYIDVEDLAAYRERIVAAGGKIHVEEESVPGMGAFCLFTDPEGRMMGLWKGAEAAGMAPFVISRAFDASRDRLWKAWTEAGQLAHWWGPKGFSVLSVKVDLRPGGVMHYGMRSPEGSEVWGRFIYREVSAPQRMVFIVSFSDAEGGLTRHPWSESWPLEMLSSVTFEERDGRTQVTVQWLPHNATAQERRSFDEGRASMQQGWSGTFDQLESYLARS